MATSADQKARVLSRAAEDGDFRARLIANPKETISAEVGTSIPEGFDVAVHEDSATAQLMLPPWPALTEVELENVAGGVFIWGYV